MIDVADGALDTGATRLMQAVCDTICPWCHIGKRRLAAALAELAAEVLAFRVI
jgi:predicted DsbA family dithiol-disulfide isomerase